MIPNLHTYKNIVYIFIKYSISTRNIIDNAHESTAQ